MEEWTQRRSGLELKRNNDNRDPYERDRARIIHSSSFRRLQAKTQVLGIGESDFYRTRLTHSLEVAQIGSGIVQHLSKKIHSSWIEHLPTIDLIITICLAHDLGHPPFGHGGEIALNYMMRNHKGFEGNGQTLRILSRLDKNTKNYGMDLTRRSMLGILKYPVRYSKVLSKAHQDEKFPNKEEYSSHSCIVAKEWRPPKCYFDEDQEIVDWILEVFSDRDKKLFQQICNDEIEEEDNKKHHKPLYKSFDTTIMNLADDIAYGIHDLEDAISLKLITKEMWKDEVEEKLKNSGSDFNKEDISETSKLLFSVHSYDRKRAIGCLVNWLISSVEVEKRGIFDNPLLDYKIALPKADKKALEIIKDFVKTNVIKNHSVQLLEFKGQQMIMSIFEAIISDPERLLQNDTIETWKEYKKMHSCDKGARIISDYISGMTDDYAKRIYKTLFLPDGGSIFHKL